MKYPFRGGCLLECFSPSLDNRLLPDASCPGREDDPTTGVAMRFPHTGEWLSSRDTLLTHTMMAPTIVS